MATLLSSSLNDTLGGGGVAVGEEKFPSFHTGMDPLSRNERTCQKTFSLCRAKIPHAVIAAVLPWSSSYLYGLSCSFSDFPSATGPLNADVRHRPGASSRPADPIATWRPLFLHTHHLPSATLRGTATDCYVPPKFRCWNPRGGALGRGSSHESRAVMNGISALRKEAPESSLSPSTTWEHGENTVMNTLGSGSSSDTTPSGALILDSPGSRTTGNTYVLFISHPVYGILL